MFLCGSLVFGTVACGGGASEGEVGGDEGLSEGTESSASGGSLDGSTGASSEDGEGGSGEDGDPPTAGAYAADISVERVEVNQAVGIDVVAGGQPIDPGNFVAPIIGGRPALVRVGWSLAEGFSPREITARVTLAHAGGAFESFEATRFVDQAADFGSYGGAFTIDIPAQSLQGGDGISVELLEADADAAEGAPSNRVPQAGSAPLEVWGDTMKIKVVVIPANDPGRDPSAYSLNDEMKGILEADLRNLYPVNEVELVWHASESISNCYSGSSVLGQLSTLRNAEGEGAGAYYHAIFPNSHSGYCEAGGMAWLEGTEAGADRVGYSVNHWGQAPNNFTHELGHNHNRDHSFNDPQYQPSSPDQADCGRRENYGFALYPSEHPAFPNFDYPALATLDDWIIPPTEGLPLNGNTCEGHSSYQTMGPALNDVMSYAYPYWINAYTYRHLAEHIRAVSALGDQVQPGTELRSLHIIEGAEGELWSYYLPAQERDPETSPASLTLVSEQGLERELPAWPKVNGEGETRGWVVDLSEDWQPTGLRQGSLVRELGLR